MSLDHELTASSGMMLVRHDVSTGDVIVAAVPPPLTWHVSGRIAHSSFVRQNREHVTQNHPHMPVRSSSPPPAPPPI
jgi:hypothetical protein